MKKLTYEEAKELYKSKGLELLEKEYKNTSEKMKCKNKDGYLFSCSVDNVKLTYENTKNIFSVKNPFAYTNILHYMKLNVKNGTELISENYQGKKVPLTFKCGNCGVLYKTFWFSFKKNKHKICNRCFQLLKKQSEIAVKRAPSHELHMKIREKGLIPLCGELKNAYHERFVVQDKEGYMGKVKLNTVLNNGSFDRYSVHNPFTIYNIRITCCKNNYDCIIPDQEFFGTKEKIKVLCNCGEEFETTINHLVHDKKFRCNKCTHRQSNIEGMVQNYLKDKNINFILEKKFENCKNKDYLPFDFYLPEYNACIEVDGVQHYQPVKFNGNKANCDENFEKIQDNDKIKNEYCKKNNIKLLRIPYWDFDSLEYINKINNFLSIKD